MKCILVALGLLTALSASADSVAFYFGEQLAGTGSAVELNINRGAVVFVPWLALDGSKFESLVMARYADSTAIVAFGPLLGTNNHPRSGAQPYFGIETRGRIGLGPAALYFRLVERHAKEGRLARFANIGLEANSPLFLARLSYQPIERNNVVIHRLAFKTMTSYRKAKLGFEVRQNLDGSNHKGALAEVSVPLK